MHLLNALHFNLLARRMLTCLVPLVLCLPAFAGSIKITSPAAGAVSANPVRVTASSSESGAYHLEIWDDGVKLGNVMASSVNATYSMSAGSHTMTIQAVTNSGGTVLNESRVIYTVPAAAASTAPKAAASTVSEAVAAGSVKITSPAAGAASVSPVRVTASASESGTYHLEVWDDGVKVANVMATSVNTTYPMSAGSHTLTVQAVADTGGAVLGESRVNYTVPKALATGGVSISSPVAGSTSVSAVRITASSNESESSHLEIWDNGYKLGELTTTSVNDVYVLPTGSHSLTVRAMGSSGTVLNESVVSFKVANSCKNSSTVECNFDQEAIDNTQKNCDPSPEAKWVANSCGSGIQGSGGADPKTTKIAAVTETGTIADIGNTSLDGHSLHLSETRGSAWSNVMFRAQSATSASATTIDSHWTLDAYVYLPNPSAHQAFEIDAQYTINGVWTKFFTECSFNEDAGTGYWAVFDTETGGWITLNGVKQNGQTPPKVPCDRSYFAQPWPGSSTPSFTGWHHIAWTFVRNSGGTVTFKTLTFDGKTTQVNFSPNSAPGGSESGNGNFSALIQLDGANNLEGLFDTVDAYVDQVSLTHTE